MRCHLAACRWWVQGHLLLVVQPNMLRSCCDPFPFFPPPSSPAPGFAWLQAGVLYTAVVDRLYHKAPQV